MKHKKQVHMVGNAHIDPVWLWQWQEGFQEIKATFRSALDRMNEYDEWIFTCSSAAFYEWVEQNDPAIFNEVRSRVAEGRWVLAGGWWVQSDCNLPCGESFVRQALLGQRYFVRTFGKIARTGYNVDSFGHHGMLPQILQKSGCDNYVFMRPMPSEKALPARVFHWQSSDGSSVKAFRIPYEYCTWPKELSQHIERCANEIADPINDVMCFFGVGNHGGGPTKENIESIFSLRQNKTPYDLVFSTPDQFFAKVEEVEEKLPCYQGDLQHHSRGCYVAHSQVKNLNRLAETSLLNAERFCVVSSLLANMQYPDNFTHAWKQVLFNQFHDILAGTSLEEAYEDALYAYGEAINSSHQHLNSALQKISWNINLNLATSARPLVVFNPHGYPVTDFVEVEWGPLDDHAVLFDDTKQETSHQRIQSHAAAKGRNRFLFKADVPALGYRVYYMDVPPVQGKTKKVDKGVCTRATLENNSIRLSFNQENGTISEFIDTVCNVNLVKGGAQPVILEDTSDTWSHGVSSYWHDTKVFPMNLVSMDLIEDGPVRSSLQVFHSWGNSMLMQTFSLYPGQSFVDVHVEVDWHEKQKMLKLRFPINFDGSNAQYEIPFGMIKRDFSENEEPGQRWVAVSGRTIKEGKPIGLALVNNAKSSYDIQEDVIDLTVLRSPVYAHHEPFTLDPQGTYTYLDQGHQEFSYRLVPYSGDLRSNEIVKHAELLNNHLIAVKESCHPGKFPLRASFISIDMDTVVLSACKQAENREDGYVLRMYETAGKPAKTKISFPLLDTVFTASFNPYEIKTFRISKDGSIVDVNLIEYTDSEMESLKGAEQ
jgi:alpha-mannosidase